MKISLLSALMLGALMVLPVAGASAQQGPTCKSMAAKCRAECPSAVAANPRIPRDCTCSQREATCRQTKAWPSWDGVRSLPVRG